MPSTSSEWKGNLQRKVHIGGIADPHTSYMTSRPARDAPSFATHLAENSSIANATNMTDSRAVRETDRRFINDTTSVAPHRRDNQSRYLSDQPIRFTHVDVRVPANYHGSSATGSSNYLSSVGTTGSHHVTSDRPIITGSSGGIHSKGGSSVHSTRDGASTAAAAGRVSGSAASSAQGSLTSSNTTFTIPASSKMSQVRSLKSHLQRDKKKGQSILFSDALSTGLFILKLVLLSYAIDVSVYSSL